MCNDVLPSIIDLTNAFYGCVDHLNKNEIKISGSEIALYMALAWIWNGTGRKNAWFSASIKRIVSYSGLSQSTIDRLRTGLKDKGLIDYEVSGNRKAARYNVVAAMDTAVIMTAVTTTTVTTTAATVTMTADYSHHDCINRDIQSITEDVSVRQDAERLSDPDQDDERTTEPAEAAASSPKKKAAKSDGAEPEAFTRFYAAYPRREKHKEALKAWKQLDPDEKLTAIIMQSVQDHAREWDRTHTERKHIPLPASFINGERWTDELEPAAAKGKAAATSISNKTIEMTAEEEERWRKISGETGGER